MSSDDYYQEKSKEKLKDYKPERVIAAAGSGGGDMVKVLWEYGYVEALEKQGLEYID